jgi:hypothetical protein
MGVVQTSTLVFEIAIFEIPILHVDENPTSIHISSIILIVYDTLPQLRHPCYYYGD